MKYVVFVEMPIYISRHVIVVSRAGFIGVFCACVCVCVLYVCVCVCVCVCIRALSGKKYWLSKVSSNI